MIMAVRRDPSGVILGAKSLNGSARFLSIRKHLIVNWGKIIGMIHNNA